MQPKDHKPTSLTEEIQYKKRVQIFLFAIVVMTFALAWIPNLFWTNYMSMGVSIVVLLLGRDEKYQRIITSITMVLLFIMILRAIFPENLVFE